MSLHHFDLALDACHLRWSHARTLCPWRLWCLRSGASWWERQMKRQIGNPREWRKSEEGGGGGNPGGGGGAEGVLRAALCRLSHSGEYYLAQASAPVAYLVHPTSFSCIRSRSHLHRLKKGQKGWALRAVVVRLWRGWAVRY